MKGTTDASLAQGRRGFSPGRHVYDVIVVGGQLSAALTTTLLAKRGYQVLWVPHDGLSGTYQVKGFALPFGPLLLPPLKSLAPLEALLAEVGLTQVVGRALLSPSLQLIRPGNWFELKRDEKERAVELKRALRTGADAFDLDLTRAAQTVTAGEALLTGAVDFPPEGWFARWRFKGQLKSFDRVDERSPLPADAPAGALRALLPFCAPLETPAPLTETRAFGRLLGGLHLFPNGQAGLCAVFAEKARELGADVLPTDEAIDALAFDGSTTTGVRLKRGETVYRADVVVAGTDLDTLLPLVPEGKRAAAKRLQPQVAAAKALFTLNAVVPEAALPRGLGSLALVLPQSSAPVLVQTTPAVGADQGELRTLSLTTTADLAVKQGHQPTVKAFTEALWAAVDFVLPFTRARAQVESAVWLDAPTVADGAAEPHPLFSLGEGSYFGVTGHTTQGPWKHLLFANRQVYPGLGLEGEVLAAQRAAHRIEKQLKKNDPLKSRKSA